VYEMKVNCNASYVTLHAHTVCACKVTYDALQLIFILFQVIFMLCRMTFVSEVWSLYYQMMTYLLSRLHLRFF